MMADLFVGGAETTTNALSGGVLLLIRNPEIWEKVKSDTEKYLEPFVEEVLRLESPVQCLLRETSVDMEMHGHTIPAGAIVSLRYAAANRDERKYDEPGGLRPGSQEPPLAPGVRAGDATTASARLWPAESSTTASRCCSSGSTRCGSSRERTTSITCRITSSGRSRKLNIGFTPKGT